MHRVLLAFAALILVAPPCAAQAVESVSLASGPHERVYDTLIAQADDGPLIESSLDWLVQQLTSDPNIAALERGNPGLVKSLRAAVRPIIAGYSQRVKLAYRPRMIAVLEGELTAAEASEIATFYASPIGRVLVSGVSQNYRADAVLGTLETDERVTTTEVSRDMDNASQATLQGLSAEQTAELYREIAAHPAVEKLELVIPKVTALRAEMEEEPMTAEEEAAIETALREVFASLDSSAPPSKQAK